MSPNGFYRLAYSRSSFLTPDVVKGVTLIWDVKSLYFQYLEWP